MQNDRATGAPIALSASTQAQTYALFALAMGLTVIGVFLGLSFAPALFRSGVMIVFVLAEFGLIFTAPFWSERPPLNYLLFGAFPLLSGITFTPYIVSILAQYVNGASILVNALLATVFLSLSAAVFARVAPNLMGLARGLLLAVLGLVILSIMQIFIPGWRVGGMELLISGAGIVIFALFTAVDIQRIAHRSRLGANPFLLALSLYLDIFNLLIMVLRFMAAFGGRRR